MLGVDLTSKKARIMKVRPLVTITPWYLGITHWRFPEMGDIPIAGGFLSRSIPFQPGWSRGTPYFRKPPYLTTGTNAITRLTRNSSFEILILQILLNFFRRTFFFWAQHNWGAPPCTNERSKLLSLGCGKTAPSPAPILQFRLYTPYILSSGGFWPGCVKILWKSSW